MSSFNYILLLLRFSTIGVVVMVKRKTVLTINAVDGHQNFRVGFTT